MSKPTDVLTHTSILNPIEMYYSSIKSKIFESLICLEDLQPKGPEAAHTDRDDVQTQ